MQKELGQTSLEYLIEVKDYDDPILNFLSYSIVTKDRPALSRTEYDCDARYYHKHMEESEVDALRGDVMASLWMPYQRALKIKTGIHYSRRISCLMKLFIKRKKELNGEGDSEGISEAHSLILDFARIAYTPGNFIQLPQGAVCRNGMNQRKGGYRTIQDRIDQAVYECFDDGRLSDFFRDDEDLTQWIESQKLDSPILFSDESITRKSVREFATGKTNPRQGKFAKFGAMEADENSSCEYSFTGYISEVISLIEERNCRLEYS